MDSYLISYEYKEKEGCLVTIKTISTVINVRNSEELNKILDRTSDMSYDRYLKILFCKEIN